MSLYEDLFKRKRAGETLDIGELTPEVLRILFIDESKSDQMIAELFEKKTSQITYLRRKNGITIRNSTIDEFINEIPKDIEEKVKAKILREDNLTKIAKAVTHFAFRNGPIEDMHADVSKNITDEDMKILNKYMVNRLAYVFMLMIEERWLEFNHVIETIDWMFGHSWDDAEPDDGGMRKLFIEKLNEFRN